MVPTGTNIYVVKNYQPLLENDLYIGAEPVSWNINSCHKCAKNNA